MKKRNENLKNEVNKIYKNCNLNSKTCRDRYEQATLNFINYIIDNHKVMELQNLQEFHILNYIDFKRNELKKDGSRKITESTLNLNITGILFTLKHAGYLKHLYPLKSPKYYLNGGEGNVKN